MTQVPYMAGACFRNRLSTVNVGAAPHVRQGGQPQPYAFRNSPHLVSFLEPNAHDAEHENEALLLHLLHHPNTAPFVAHRFIQRFVTSNPSPRYVAAVATAFRTGVAGGVTYSGEYGDLGATVAAVLSDREARSAAL